ncbi:MAG: DUF3552 domain-containing protein, partial [Clostridia bacterium]|nr:DUF3552 domain-containing protein [Clostridia bacterium]
MTTSAMCMLLSLDFLSGLLGAVIGIAIGAPATYFVYKYLLKNKSSKDAIKAKNILEEAQNEAKNLKKEAILEAKEEVHKLTTECDQEIKERRAEIQKNENRLIQREEYLDKKEDALEKKNENIEKLKEELQQKEQSIQKRIDEQVEITNKMTAELERISKLTKEEAKKELINKYEDEAKKDAAVLVKEIEQNAKDEAEKKARDIVALAIQQTAVDHTSEVTVST